MQPSKIHPNVVVLEHIYTLYTAPLLGGVVVFFFAFPCFQHSLACLVQAAAAAEPSGAAEQHVAEEDEWDLQLDLEARKAGLRSQLAKFSQVSFDAALSTQNWR